MVLGIEAISVFSSDNEAEYLRPVFTTFFQNNMLVDVCTSQGIRAIVLT